MSGLGEFSSDLTPGRAFNGHIILIKIKTPMHSLFHGQNQYLLTKTMIIQQQRSATDTKS